ncbi:MAG: M24B family metallopeptidase, partial [Candidatus Saccharimonadales bacterium]
TGWRYLKDALKKSNQVATLAASPSYERHHGLFANPTRARLIRKLKRLDSKLEITDLRRALAQMRVIKQPLEVAAIQKAIDITANGIEAVCSNLTNYKYESEIEAELSRYFRLNGADGHAFLPIVAGGKNACTLHNIANNSKLNPGDLAVIDVGAEVDNYAADITRTLAIGRVSKRQQQVYDAVLAAQNYALELLKPGVDFKIYETKVGKFLGDRLVELKLIRGSSDRNAVTKYCPHATSHFLGLDVHDVGDYLQPLKANMVLTVEPGIYIPEEDIGVRIEDDVIITEGGNRILSRDLPRELMLN